MIFGLKFNFCREAKKEQKANLNEKAKAKRDD